MLMLVNLKLQTIIAEWYIQFEPTNIVQFNSGFFFSFFLNYISSNFAKFRHKYE